MKFQIQVQTPYGIIKSKVVQDATQDDFDQVQKLCETFETYFSFEDEDGAQVILKNEVAKNSIFKLVKTD